MHRVPIATYRVQLHRGFTFRDVRRIVPYLSSLGISDLYCSPILRAREGSTHGYDVVDATEISIELGGEAAFLELQNELKKYRMGFLLDIVPNHMAAVPENAWWMSVLENGPHSRFINYFDIEWRPLLTGAKQENKVLLPVLGRPYGEALESGELRLGYSRDGFAVHYFEKRFPIAPHTYAMILGPMLPDLDRETSLYSELEGLVSPPGAQSADSPALNVNSRFLKDNLWRLNRDEPGFRALLDARITAMNGTGEIDSLDALDHLLDSQWYRLSYWRAASEEINYRRFFDVTDLVGVRVESPEVFEARHAKVFELVEKGFVTGVRIDHIDGLFDPAAHLRKLQNRFGRASGMDQGKTFYVVVEKILGSDETLPEGFHCDGTTGYESLVRLNDVFVDSEGERALNAFWKRIAPHIGNYEEVVRDGKRQVIDELFSGEIRGLAMRLLDIAATDRSARDFSYSDILEGLTAVTVELDVYRTYIRNEEIDDDDRRRIERAIARAGDDQSLERRLFEFFSNVLLVRPPRYVEDRSAWLEFTMRWQQFTGRVMAKGVEDTAFYRFNRLISRNEVGGEPGAQIDNAVARFHEHNSNLATFWPHSMNASSTHDTKRSEDVRARISARSEFPDEYQKLYRSASRQIEANPEDLHLILQSLIGVWPLQEAELRELPQRMGTYLEKAAREAKVQSSWLRPNQEYERGLKEVSDSLIVNPPFQKECQRLVLKVAWTGILNSLVQTLEKIN